MRWSLFRWFFHRWSLALRHASRSQILGNIVQIPRYVMSEFGIQWGTDFPQDPTVYTIIQDVYRAPDPPASTGSSGRPRPVLIFSAIYHFRYPASVRAPPPAIPPPIAYQSSLTNNPHAYPNRALPSQYYSMSPPHSHPGMFQPHEYTTQNRLDEPFMLDVSLENFSLDDFMINIHDSPEAPSNDVVVQSSSSSFPKDIRNYVSVSTPLGASFRNSASHLHQIM